MTTPITSEFIKAGPAGEIDGDLVEDGGISNAKIADGAVTTIKVADGAITQAKLDSGVVSQLGGGGGGGLNQGQVDARINALRQFTTAQADELIALAGDIRAQGWLDAANIRIGAASRTGSYTLANARAYTTWQANGGVVNSGGSLLNNRHVLIESQTELDTTDPRLRVVITFNGAAEIGDAAQSVTQLGANLAGDRWFYDAEFLRLQGNAEVRVQDDAPTELENVDVPYANITGKPNIQQRPQGVSTLPPTLVSGDEYVLTASVDFQPFYAVTPSDSGGVVGAVLPSPQWNLNRYPGNHAVAALRGAFVLLAGQALTDPHITIDGTEYALVTLSGSGVPHNTYQVSGFPPGNWVAGTEYSVWLRYGTARAPAIQHYDVGDYLAATDGRVTTANPRVLITRPGSTADWAQAGNTRLIPASKIPYNGATSLIEGAGIGISYVGVDIFQPLQLYDPKFNLSAASNQHGLLAVDYTARIATPNTGIGFGEDGAREHRFSGDAGANTLRDSTTYAANQTNGVQIGDSVAVYRGSTKVGDLSLYLAHNAANELGYYFHFDAASTTTADNFALSVVAYAAYVQSAGSGGGGTAASAVFVDRASAEVILAEPASAATWSGWTDLFSETIATAGVYHIDLNVEAVVEAQGSPAGAWAAITSSGGGDRIAAEVELRVGNARLARAYEYIRNLPAAQLAGSSSVEDTLASAHNANVGDVISVRVRWQMQTPGARGPSGTGPGDAGYRTAARLRFPAGDSHLHLVSWGAAA